MHLRSLLSALILLAATMATWAQPRSIDPALLAKATAGDAASEYRVGLAYATGDGVEQDLAQAAAWYRKAAVQGLAAAQLSLGVLYDHGMGVPQDYEAAAAWYQKAALQGVAEAQFNLGSFYERGVGVPQDYTQAADLYRRAAVQGKATPKPTSGWRWQLPTGAARIRSKQPKPARMWQRA